MQLVNEFRVPVTADKAWDVLTDVERIAPCMPGATLLTVDGDDFTGEVKVKVGPITVSYRGKASFLEKDEAAHRAVLKANGKETRGQGNAAATVTAQLKDDGDGTICVLTTDLTISGKAAQFGRGVLADVAGKLIGQFADRLEADVLSDNILSDKALSDSVVAASDAQALTGDSGAAVAAAPAMDAGSVDLLKVVAMPIAKRALPVVAGLVVGAGIGFLLGRGTNWQ